MQDNFVNNPEFKTMKDYLIILKDNLFPILLITAVGTIFAVFYAINAVDIYKSSTSLKITKEKGSILESDALFPSISSFTDDRFISNEIEILKTFSLRLRVADAVLDSFKTNKNESEFSIIFESQKFNQGNEKVLKTDVKIAEELASLVDIEQKRGLDVIIISASSPSPKEATLVSETYAKVYQEINLEFNRNQLTLVKKFLSQQREEKLNDLNIAEDILTKYQQAGGIIALDQQATTLISQLSSFEADKNMKKIEIMASEKILTKLKEELKKQDPTYSTYLENLASEAYLQNLQTEIARLEVNRDLVIASNPDATQKQAIADYNKKIDELKKKLNQKLEVLKAGVYANSPEELKEISKNIITEEIKLQSNKISLEQLERIIGQYEAKFSVLPKSSIELARLQRNREALEKLYALVEQRFQEALINEQSQPGNVYIIDRARVPNAPAKPNRNLIILVGFALGLGIALGFAFVRNYFDNTVKSPDDIQKRNLALLAWIPKIEGLGVKGSDEFEFIVHKKPDSIPAEAFRALRTRIQFSKTQDEEIKTVLVTSSAPAEGKTIIAANLAGSFAQLDKKVLILDCDLRKPRIHAFMGANRYPGLVDYLLGQTSYDEVLRKSEMKNLDYITAGTIPPNPAELLESPVMLKFLEELKAKYDMVIVDSPPIIAVTDSEILARECDASMLVVSADTTEIELLERSAEIMKANSRKFIGTVLNNFVYRSSYGSYYKYYYYYSRQPKKDMTGSV